MKKYIEKVTALLLIIVMMAVNIPVVVFAEGAKPSISITAPSSSTRYVGESVSYTVTFTDNTGIDSIPMNSSHVVLNGFAGTVAVTGSGNSRKVTITNIQGTVGPNKTIYIKAGAAKDAVGNETLETPNSLAFAILEKAYVDNVKPSISITAPSSSTRYVGESVSYTVTFTDNIGIDSIPMNSSHVVLNGFAGTVAVTGSGNSRKVTITNIQGTVGPNKTIYIKAGAAKDAVGNETLETPNTIDFTILKYTDDVTPSISISAPSSSIRYVGESVSYTVTFTDNIGITSVPMNSSHVVLNGFTGTVTVTGSGYSERTVTITNIQGTVGPNKTIYIKSGAAEDADGNQTLQTPNSLPFEIVAPAANATVNGGKLPKTGINLFPLLIGGLALVITGTVTIMVAKNMNKANKKWRNFSPLFAVSLMLIVLGIGCIVGVIAIIWGQNYYSKDNIEIYYEPISFEFINKVEEEILYKVYPKEGDNIGSLTIPSLNQTIPLFEGTGKKELKKGAGHFIGSVLPGEKDNCVLSGHRDRPFNKIGNLKKGDKLITKTSAGTFIYEVSESKIVNDNDKTVIVPTDHAVLTLVTCYPFNSLATTSKRYIVSADLVKND